MKADGWRRWAALLALLFAPLPQLGAGEFTRLSSRTVTTKYGALKGYIETPSPPQSAQQQQRHLLQPVEVFLGVPYAAPPTGAMRFMPPVSPAHWSGVRMADRLAPVCPQRLPDIGSESEAVKRMPLGRLEYLRRLLPHLQRHSEDCLYLNIYTPAVGQSIHSPILSKSALEGGTAPLGRYLLLEEMRTPEYHAHHARTAVCSDGQKPRNRYSLYEKHG